MTLLVDIVVVGRGRIEDNAVEMETTKAIAVAIAGGIRITPCFSQYLSFLDPYRCVI
jgi:hypothetical protein